LPAVGQELPPAGEWYVSGRAIWMQLSEARDTFMREA